MDTRKEFLRIMAAQTEIALATSVDDRPNVRIVNFYYHAEDNRLYFTTFRDNDKVAEFSRNSKVAFTTVPYGDATHVKGKGTVSESRKVIGDLKAEFAGKIEGYEETIEQAGEFLGLYEIECGEVMVTLDFEQIEALAL